jgi:DNA repair protein RecN (Recombination protein N)
VGQGGSSARVGGDDHGRVRGASCPASSRASDPSVPVDTPAGVIHELRVENLLLIERAELRLAEGLNVLTGETGAGKTVLAHALDLLLGGRARAGIVRSGAAEAYVEGVFALPDVLEGERGELLPADAEEVVLARRVGADGRTRAQINGRTATVADLRRLGTALLTFYGQHEHRKLTLAAAQLEILDGYCGPEQAARRAACAAAHREVRELRERAEQLRELEDARERELDLLEHELAEIEQAAPGEGEPERLRTERERLRQLDALLAAAGQAAEALAGGQGSDAHDAPGAAALGAQAAACLEGVAGVDPQLDALAERARALAIEAGDLAGELRGYGERLEDEAAGAQARDADAQGQGDAPWAGGSLAGRLQGGVAQGGGVLVDSGMRAKRVSPESVAGAQGGVQAGGLQAVEERLATLERLLRKHGPTVATVWEQAERAYARREELQGAAEALEETTARLQAAEETLQERVEALRAARVQAAPRLAEAVCKQLAALAMPDATFAVQLTEREPGPSGGDVVELEIAPNPGVAAGPLREIASGGELSRVMLALSTVSAEGGGAAGPNSNCTPTLVFDEVDAGIGGHTARTVGERLRDLATTHQVICITHHPQIASLATRHFSVVKESAKGQTRTSVEQLAEPEVLSELVRMLGAPDRDAAARRHARELRRAA